MISIVFFHRNQITNCFLFHFSVSTLWRTERFLLSLFCIRLVEYKVFASVTILFPPGGGQSLLKLDRSNQWRGSQNHGQGTSSWLQYNFDFLDVLFIKDRCTDQTEQIFTVFVDIFSCLYCTVQLPGTWYQPYLRIVNQLQRSFDLLALL